MQIYLRDEMIKILSYFSRHTIINPATTIKIAPGNSCPKGFSEKKNQPRNTDDGIPKYSKGAKMVGDVAL